MKRKRKRVPFATGKAVLRAYGRAAKRVLDGTLASSESAGFVDGPDGRIRLQVFVVVARYDEDLFRSSPETGGLLKYAMRAQGRKRRRTA